MRSDGDGRSLVTDGPFTETKDLIAGWPGAAAAPAMITYRKDRQHMTSSRHDADAWDPASSVGATATMAAAVRAIASRADLIDDPFAEPPVRHRKPAQPATG